MPAERFVNVNTGQPIPLSGAASSIFGASGPNHSIGLVPDPGVTPGTSNFLREDGVFATPPSGGGVSLAGNNSWTGHQYFKSGRPWTDIIAWGADPTGAVSSDTAIQNAINFMAATFGGGIVFCPPGIYAITTGITVKSRVRLVGAGRDVSYISGFVTNVDTIHFDSSCLRGCSLEHLTAQGYFNANVALVTSNTVTVAQDIPVYIGSCTIWYGNAGLVTSGIDGHCFDTWIMGCQDCIVSNGANWYNRCIFDGNGSFASQRYAFWQGVGFAGATSQENAFVMCDFSGVFTKSVFIDDSFGGTFCLPKFSQCVLSGPIDIQHSYFTTFSQCEFGTDSFTVNAVTGGSVSVIGSVGFGVTIHTPAAVLKSANFNIV
jgi:hypothetical protein